MLSLFLNLLKLYIFFVVNHLGINPGSMCVMWKCEASSAHSQKLDCRVKSSSYSKLVHVTFKIFVYPCCPFILEKE